MKFKYGQLVARVTGGPVMRVIDTEEITTEHIANGRYVISHYEPHELRSLSEFMDIFFERKVEKTRKVEARKRYEKRKADLAAKKSRMEEKREKA